MLNYIKYFLKRNISLNSQVLKIKFYLGIGIEPEAKYILKKFKLNFSVDIGSNSGHFTNILSKISNKVYSFEPIKYLYQSQKEIFKNKNVKVFNYAIGNRKSVKKFFIPKNNDPESSFFLRNKNSDEILVNILPADSFLKNCRVDFIKIDVEGFESEVIKGLKNIIKKNKTIFLIEVEKRHNKNFIEIFNFFLNKKYEVYFLDKNEKKLNSLTKKDIKLFINKHQKLKDLGSERYINNFFFKHKNHHFFENK